MKKKEKLIFIEIDGHIVEKASEYNKDISFQNSLALTFFNIYFKEDFSYNLNNDLDRKLYTQEYFFTINKVIHSFNAYLVDKYCYHILKNDNEAIKSFAEKKKNGNSIGEIIRHFVKKNCCTKEDIVFLTIYENLFRHQLSHGWLNFFNLLLNVQQNGARLFLNNMEGLSIDNIIKSDELLYIEFSDGSPLNLKDLRGKLKKASVKDYTSIYTYIESSLYPYNAIKAHPHDLKEIIFKVYSNSDKNSENYITYKKLLKQLYISYIDKNEKKSKRILNKIENFEKLNSKFFIKFSLNNLCNSIINIVENIQSLEYNP